MYDLYTWSTPNGRKVSIMLEELGAAYNVIPVDITRGETTAPDYLALNPHGKIPVLIDRENGMKIIESGAILLYLAQKHDRFLGDGVEAWEAIQWIMWQMSALGPMLGQAHHFLYFHKGASSYAEERFRGLTRNLYAVLEQHLAHRSFITGEYGVADMASFPWIARFQRHEIDIHAYPNIMGWYRRIAERPAAQRGYAVPTPEPIPTV